MTKKRRVFSPEYKAKIVLDILSGQRSVAQTAREEQISETLLLLLLTWKRGFVEQAPSLFKSEQQRDEQAQKMTEMEAVIGRQTLEIEGLKKVSRWLHSVSSAKG